MESTNSSLPGFEDSSEEKLPDDIQAAMDILSGKVDIGDMIPNGEPEAPPQNKQQNHPGLKDRWQNSLLKKHEIEKAIEVNTDFEIFVFDLADKADCQQYQDLLNRISSPETKKKINVSEIQNFLDTSSPRGFRSIINVTVCSVSRVLPPTADSPKYTTIDPNPAS